VTERQRTIVFFPEGAFGPTNNCVGIGDVLRRRGHRVVFVVESSFAGTLEAQGFEEALMRLGPPPEEPEVPGQFWKDFIRDTAPVFRTPTIQQLGSFLAPTWQALIDGSIYVNARLEEIFEELQPDAIVEDNVVAFPAVATAGRPWARIMSCNPLEMPDPDIPPVFSGYPTAGDRAAWRGFEAERDRTHREMWEGFDAFTRDAGAPGLPDLGFMVESPSLNLSLSPAEADYVRAAPLGATWHRLDSCVRETDDAFEWPSGFEPDRAGAAPLLYLSLGSLGSADVELMERLVAIMADTPYRVIVSKGPQADRFDLAPNMWGQEFVPQTRILPAADVVITHGGNNTVTECFHAGIPMIVLPLFWDQYDNAQRVDELGFGLRLDTYRCTAQQLTASIERLLAAQALRARMRAISVRLQPEPGTVKAADLIERLAAGDVPSTR
jgi:MGT family glycosyltransferase